MTLLNGFAEQDGMTPILHGKPADVDDSARSGSTKLRRLPIGARVTSEWIILVDLGMPVDVHSAASSDMASARTAFPAPYA